MGDHSKIQWTDATWNPVTGCTHVSEGCRNCYAERLMPRLGQKFADLVLHPDRLAQPLRWKKPRRVFVNSLSDLFHEEISDDFIVAVFGVMTAAPQHVFQVLTKRPERMRKWVDGVQAAGGIGRCIRSIRVDGDRTIPTFFNANSKTEVVRGKLVRRVDDPWMQVFNAAACTGPGPLANLWLGVSCEDQQTADVRVPLLLRTPAAVRFVSAEPLLGPIDLTMYLVDGVAPATTVRKLDWVIVGGESGPKARPCDVRWIRSLLTQCREAKTPCFVKQVGSRPTGSGRPWFDRGMLRESKGGDPAEWPEDLRVREWPA